MTWRALSVRPYRVTVTTADPADPVHCAIATAAALDCLLIVYRLSAVPASAPAAAAPAPAATAAAALLRR